MLGPKSGFKMVFTDEPCVTSVEVISTRTTNTSLCIVAPACFWRYIRCHLLRDDEKDTLSYHKVDDVDKIEWVLHKTLPLQGVLGGRSLQLVCPPLQTGSLQNN